MRGLRDWLSSEARLLLAASRRDAAPASLRALIGSDFRWPVFEALTQRQLATRRMFTQLRALPAGVVPAGVLERLSAGAMVAEFRQHCLEQALKEVTATLAVAGVRVLLLKGAALALTVYPSFAGRGMQDLDLLIAPEDEQRASQALVTAGWVPAYPVAMRPFFESHHHSVPLEAPRLGNARVELHTELFHAGPFTITPDDLRRDAQSITVAGHSVQVPSRAHLLLHLCQHYAWSHCMARGLVRTLQDIELLWSMDGGFDAAFVRLAHEARAATCCYWTLRFARRLFDITIPDPLLSELRPPRASWLLDLLERHFAGVAGLTTLACPSVRVERALWSWGVMPRWSGHADARPWFAGDAWLAVAPAGDDAGEAASFWRRKRQAFTAYRRYAAALLR